MAEHVPILVGITGKRDLKGQEARVRECLERALDAIDRETPHAPKVLLSGMAIGADTLAVELAAARPNWLVAAILPFDRQTYLEDFSGDERAALETWLTHPKVKSYPLPLLDNPYTHRRCTRAELRNGPNGANPLRVMHYEQLGLWLAHAATLLIAVLPTDEQPDQAGGTARVVQYRLCGRLDATAHNVIGASHVVAPPLELDIAPLGPVWLIDAPSERHRSHAFQACLDERDKRELEPAARRRHGRMPEEERRRKSLAVARGIDGLAERAGGTEPFAWRTKGSEPVAMLGAIHVAIDDIQGRHKRRLVSSSYILAVLFWLAVGTYGLIEMIRRDHVVLAAWSLGAYLSMVLAAVLLHEIVDRLRWQRITEDYRGVTEALRVQRAWWQAGLLGPEDQVDRFFFDAAPLPFAYVRHAVRNIVYWVRLDTEPRTAHRNWSEVYAQDNPHSWIMGQIKYFRARAARRKRQTARAQMLSWEAFFAAQFVAVWLFIDSLAPPPVDRFLMRSSPWLLPLGLIGAGLLWLVRHIPERSSPAPRSWSAAFALLLAVLMGAGLYCTRRPLGSEFGELAIPLAVVVLSTAAVAIRYVAEKLVWEAEAHRYEAALALFEQAAGELDLILGDEPSAAIPDEAIDVVRALGRAALEENEYWLRSHRERPVEQAVG